MKQKKEINIELNIEKEETLAQRIRVVRGYFGKSQEAFAKDLDISQSAMSAIELGRVVPSADVIQKIGRMGFDLEWLIYGETNKKPDKMPNTNFEKIRINKLLSFLTQEEIHFCRKWLELYLKSLKKEE